jgi:predicted ester cyclase
MPVFRWTVPAVEPPGMTLEEMKNFVKHHFEVFVNQKDSTQAERSFAPDFLDHDEPTGIEVGIESAKAMMEKAYLRWPDLHVTVEDILAEGDRVMVRNRWTATESSSGQRVEFHGFVLWRFANRKIVERWATLTPPRPLAGASQGVVDEHS